MGNCHKKENKIIFVKYDKSDDGTRVVCFSSQSTQKEIEAAILRQFGLRDDDATAKYSIVLYDSPNVISNDRFRTHRSSLTIDCNLQNNKPDQPYLVIIQKATGKYFSLILIKKIVIFGKTHLNRSFYKT